MKMHKKYLLGLIMAPLLMANEGCSDADIASRNISLASEQFEVVRRVTLYNVIQDTAVVTAEGMCSVEFMANYNEVTCKDDNGELYKHMMRESDNMTMMVEQLVPIGVSEWQYRYIVKPSVVIPDLDIVIPGMEGNS